MEVVVVVAAVVVVVVGLGVVVVMGKGEEVVVAVGVVVGVGVGVGVGLVVEQLIIRPIIRITLSEKIMLFTFILCSFKYCFPLLYSFDTNYYQLSKLRFTPFTYSCM